MYFLATSDSMDLQVDGCLGQVQIMTVATTRSMLHSSLLDALTALCDCSKCFRCLPRAPSPTQSLLLRSVSMISTAAAVPYKP